MTRRGFAGLTLWKYIRNNKEEIKAERKSDRIMIHFEAYFDESGFTPGYQPRMEPDR